MKASVVVCALLLHVAVVGAQRSCNRPDTQTEPCVGAADGSACSFVSASSGLTVCGVCAGTNRCPDLCVGDGSTGCGDVETTSAPETDVPETDAPETDVPETDVPETAVPETDVPQTDAPETDVPETAVPEGESAGTPVEEADLTCTDAPLDGNSLLEPCMDTHIVPSLIAPIFAHQTTLTSTAGRLEVTLTVEQHQLDAGAFKKNVRAYCYEGVCSVPGPTLRVFPGDTVVLTLVNNLLDVEPEQETSDGEGLNAMRQANITNMHTHGLHVDPSADNVIIGVAPGGGSKTYTYEIPANHLPGTHWYHSHHHGSSSLQV